MGFENAGQRSRRPVVGASVVSISGRRLGLVAEVSGDAFCLEQQQERIWLGAEAIFTVDAGVVSLICESEGVSKLAVPPPNTGG
jgi:hypothetical protein